MVIHQHPIQFTARFLSEDKPKERQNHFKTCFADHVLERKKKKEKKKEKKKKALRGNDFIFL